MKFTYKPIRFILLPILPLLLWWSFPVVVHAQTVTTDPAVTAAPVPSMQCLGSCPTDAPTGQPTTSTVDPSTGIPTGSGGFIGTFINFLLQLLGLGGLSGSGLSGVGSSGSGLSVGLISINPGFAYPPGGPGGASSLVGNLGSPTSPSSGGQPTTGAKLSNWAGWSYNLPSGLTTASISASVSVPTVDCSQTSKAEFAGWIGFGGLEPNIPNIAQLGSAERCEGNQAKYIPWTEAFPAAPVYYEQYAVSPGDQIDQSVQMQSVGTFLTEETNSAKGWTISLPMTFSGWTPLTGEYAFEAPKGMAPYSPAITFSKATHSENGQAAQQASTATGLQKLEMEDKSTGQQKTTTSDLSGDTFTVSGL